MSPVYILIGGVSAHGAASAKADRRLRITGEGRQCWRGSPLGEQKSGQKDLTPTPLFLIIGIGVSTR